MGHALRLAAVYGLGPTRPYALRVRCLRRFVGVALGTGGPRPQFTMARSTLCSKRTRSCANCRCRERAPALRSSARVASRSASQRARMDEATARRAFWLSRWACAPVSARSCSSSARAIRNRRLSRARLWPRPASRRSLGVRPNRDVLEPKPRPRGAGDLGARVLLRTRARDVWAAL